ncbi:hypothetical protein KAR10_10415 [bacterium]|nr:hypothetical protein [bacterium]
MIELETSLHLAQPPLYSGSAGVWKQSFVDAAGDCPGKLTWDPAAVLSMLSFSYVCGDRTLVNEVKRRPWLSEISDDGKACLEKIPPHGRMWKSYDEITENFIRLLCKEATEACRERSEIYILMSGGMDSRVAASILAKVYAEGKLGSRPIAVTWGPDDCRDVVYGRQVATILGFDWKHIDLGPENVMDNIEEVSLHLGSLVSPVHLHRMNWFKGVSSDALVIGGSYGDMVGRAEFSGRHLLELDFLRPANTFGLIRSDILSAASDGLNRDLKELHDRTPGEPGYVLCEHEMHGHYTRSHLNHAMSVINSYCRLYQMFTHPGVYSYMWSLHPWLRFDEIYARTLAKLYPELARLPWARSNRAIKGKTIGAKAGLRRNFHDYGSWISGSLFDRLSKYIVPEWFGETGIFDCEKVHDLTEKIRDKKVVSSLKSWEIWVWLAAFRRMAERLQDMAKPVELDAATRGKPSRTIVLPKREVGTLRRLVSRSDSLYAFMRYCRKIFKKVRKGILRHKSIFKYPPDNTRN